jgi:group I intron endonuclease
MSSIYSIYKATNTINGKVYIGFDSSWPKRLKKHKIDSKFKNYKFHRAIRKHGWDNFKWEVIYQSYDYEHCLKTMESHFITEYDSFTKGYNSTLGGEGTLGHKKTISEESKKKMSISQTGQIKSIETKLKISKTMSGKSKSKIHCKNISKGQKGKPKKPSHVEKIRLHTEPIHLCPHCNKMFNFSKLKQWHLDKCKMKITSYY